MSSVPEAPTSVPLMISAGCASTKPVAATASPVNELSSEITTGMSAPPIGITMQHAERERRRAADQERTARAARRAARRTTSRQVQRTAATLSALLDRGGDRALRDRCPAACRTRRRCRRTRCEPITRRTWSAAEARCAPGCIAGPAACRNSTVETSAAAPPPQPLSSATICGMSVISTRARAPRAERRRRARCRRRSAPVVDAEPGQRSSVASTATAMPSGRDQVAAARAAPASSGT